MRQHLWSAKNNHRVSVYVSEDRHNFVAEIQAGIDGETYLSVGYSSPNFAWVEDNMVTSISDALDFTWKKSPKKPLDEMLPVLYDLCKTANHIYNKHLFA